MPQQKTAYRPTPTNPNTPAEPQVREQHDVDLDDFMDEIDAMLEENALEVVRAYHQRGGE